MVAVQVPAAWAVAPPQAVPAARERAEFDGLSAEDGAAMAKLQWFMDHKISFNQLQSQQPQTLAHALAGFAGDFSGVRRFAERDHKNLVQWNTYPAPGGHYAAHLEPDVLADDIRDFYRRYQQVA